MKLLFDANVSHRLVRRLADEYPDSTHVREVGLRGADDRQIWEFARANAFIIVSKDTDFRERSYVEGFPPKKSSGSAMPARKRSRLCCSANASASSELTLRTTPLC